jgi:hypothetical protein
VGGAVDGQQVRALAVGDEVLHRRRRGGRPALGPSG